jgi:hypothetical protein
MNIVLIGPGQLFIPAKGRSGTEPLVWNHIKELHYRLRMVTLYQYAETLKGIN